MIQNVMRSSSNVTEQDLAQHMRQTFNYMTGGVALSGVVAYLTMSNPALLAMAMKSQLLFLGIWFAYGFFGHKILFNVQPTAALGIFAGFSALTGFCLTPLVYAYTGASVVTAFVIASVMFAGASLYGYATNKSMDGMRSFIVMGSWGILAAVAVNIIMSMMGISTGGFSTILSMIIVPFVALTTAFEINQIKEQYVNYSSDEVLRSRMAIYGASTMYMNFVVMFIHLLQILGVARGEE